MKESQVAERDVLAAARDAAARLAGELGAAEYAMCGPGQEDPIEVETVAEWFTDGLWPAFHVLARALRGEGAENGPQ